eukprot:m.478205 g.478205  ORF g.478205 m.478205 type:complete len:82 (+) comp45793_c0_seq1:1-246(+)
MGSFRDVIVIMMEPGPFGLGATSKRLSLEGGVLCVAPHDAHTRPSSLAALKLLCQLSTRLSCVSPFAIPAQSVATVTVSSS